MYNETVTRLFQQPYHHERPDAFDVEGQAGTPGEGPYLSLFLSVEGERILCAHFQTYGCPSAIACGSWMCRWAEGRTFAQVSVLDAESLMRVLGGLPLGKEHAPQLAVTALKRALEQAAGIRGTGGRRDSPVRADAEELARAAEATAEGKRER